MDTDKEIKPLAASVTEQGTVDQAVKVMAECRTRLRNGSVMNHWGTAMLTDAEIAERSASVINDLVAIINRLTKDMSCGRCGNTGSVIERMGGCRDDNESVICPKCKGRFK